VILYSYRHGGRSLPPFTTAVRGHFQFFESTIYFRKIVKKLIKNKKIQYFLSLFRIDYCKEMSFYNSNKIRKCRLNGEKINKRTPKENTKSKRPRIKQGPVASHLSASSRLSPTPRPNPTPRGRRIPHGLVGDRGDR
jgi:hypothetical protein